MSPTNVSSETSTQPLSKAHAGHELVRVGPPFPRLLVSLLVVCCFGPYLIGGIRSDQVAVYLTAAFALPWAILNLSRHSRCLAILAVWSLLAVVAYVGALWPPSNYSPWSFGEVRAGLDNVTLPIGIAIVVLAVTSLSERVVPLVKQVSLWVVTMCAVNTLAAMLTAFAGVNWTLWWSSDQTSTAMRAATQGRSSGLLNQPAEAGLLYGIGMLCALYLWAGRPRRAASALAVLVVGGTLSVSKVFLVVALPLTFWLLIRKSPYRWRVLSGLGSVGLLVGLLTMSGKLPTWGGSEQLGRLLTAADRSAPIAVMTANRFGEDSTLEPVIHAVWSGPQWFGFGAAGLDIAYDNAWVASLVLAGIIGVLSYSLVLFMMLRAWRNIPMSGERTLLGGLLLLTAFASVGIPALTANRVSVLLWLLLLLLVAHARKGRAAVASPKDCGDAGTSTSADADLEVSRHG